MLAAVSIPNFGPYADAAFVTDLAVRAEQAGWDAFFMWDHITRDVQVDVADPWILLTVVASATSRIRLGPLVTPLPRRRPEKLAREAVTLDHVSAGRLVLGVGVGGGRPAGEQAEYAAFGDRSDLRTRAERLDEALDVVTALWSGEPVQHVGAHYRVDGARFTPRPVQQPRVPIWVGGTWPNRGPVRRAARWDAYVPMLPGMRAFTVSDVQAIRAALPPTTALVVNGRSDPASAAADLAPLADAGADWWLEHPLPDQQSAEDVVRRLDAGPCVPQG